MQEVNAQPVTQPTPTPDDGTPTQGPAPVDFHWIMTVQTNDGRQGTNNGRIGAIPGIHTHESTYDTVFQAMQKWMDTPNCTVVYFSLTPNAITPDAGR